MSEAEAIVGQIEEVVDQQRTFLLDCDDDTRLEVLDKWEKKFVEEQSLLADISALLERPRDNTADGDDVSNAGDLPDADCDSVPEAASGVFRSTSHTLPVYTFQCETEFLPSVQYSVSLATGSHTQNVEEPIAQYHTSTSQAMPAGVSISPVSVTRFLVELSPAMQPSHPMNGPTVVTASGSKIMYPAVSTALCPALQPVLVPLTTTTPSGSAMPVSVSVTARNAQVTSQRTAQPSLMQSAVQAPSFQPAFTRGAFTSLPTLPTWNPIIRVSTSMPMGPYNAVGPSQGVTTTMLPNATPYNSTGLGQYSVPNPGPYFGHNRSMLKPMDLPLFTGKARTTYSGDSDFCR